MGNELGFIILNVYALIVLLLTTFIFFKKERQRLIEDQTYSLFLIINIVVLVSGLILGMCVNSNYVLPLLFLIILNKIYLSSLILWISILTFYTVYISFIKSDNNILVKVRRLSIMIMIFCIIIVFILPVEIIKNDNSVIAEGAAVVFTYSFFAILFLLQVICLIVDKKNLNNKKYIPIYSLIFFGIIVLFVIIFNPKLNYIVNPSLILIVLLMYHTIENPDVKMIAALNEAKLSAEKANRAKSDFLSSMSHEIRTPLNAIVGFSDCILEDQTLEEAKSDANDIKLASENLLEIVNGILDISKIEADKMEIVETDYNPVEMLENVAKLVKPRLEDKPIELFVRFAPDIPYLLHGDGGKLRQIVTNILTNAAKYTEEGRITFYVNCVNESDYSNLVISVEDTGRGIKPEQIDKLFTKFQRLDEDKNTTLEGTGLGLAITKRFVEMMGGKIIVQSKYGEGSKFTVYLKQNIVKLNKPTEEEIKEQKIDEQKINFSNAKVLIVDDNKVNIKVCTKLLYIYGIKSDACYSGQECLDLINTGNNYDLILLDDMMPKMSGGETLKHLKEIVGFSTPVVALTANAISGMKEKYLADGFTDYISKPIERNELYRVLVTYIRKDYEVKEVKRDSEITKEIKTIDEYADYSGKRALIVDDNKINIKIAAKLIDNYKFTIDEALSGEECLNLVKKEKYDIIFLDYMMPGMDGIETLNHLREIEGFNTPVVCLTADAVEGSKEKFLNAGFDDYIPKPINRDLMDEVIKRNLEKN